jgi:hypothetical protein
MEGMNMHYAFNIADFQPLDDMIWHGHKIGPGVKRYGNPRSKYMPHQGKQEIARRLSRGL